MNALSLAAAPPRIDADQARRIAKHVRGTGLFRFRRRLFDACASAGADCSDIVPWSRCIESRLRDAEFLVRDTVDGIPTVRRGDLFDADAWCQAQRPPDTTIADPLNPNPAVTLPALALPQASPVLVGAAVVAVGVAAWAIHAQR